MVVFNASGTINGEDDWTINNPCIIFNHNTKIEIKSKMIKGDVIINGYTKPYHGIKICIDDIPFIMDFGFPGTDQYQEKLDRYEDIRKNILKVCAKYHNSEKLIIITIKPDCSGYGYTVEEFEGDIPITTS